MGALCARIADAWLAGGSFRGLGFWLWVLEIFVGQVHQVLALLSIEALIRRRIRRKRETVFVEFFEYERPLSN